MLISKVLLQSIASYPVPQSDGRRGGWWATVHGFSKELDMAKQNKLIFEKYIIYI